MFELINGLKILHFYTENVFFYNGHISVDISQIILKRSHERKLSDYDWIRENDMYMYEIEEVYSLSKAP
jgi:hypothetical protein